MEAFTILDAHHPHEPHWYLGFLGVQPALQGLGLGSALLQATLVGVDAAGEPAYLEATSADNRRLYERHGFEVVRELPLPGGPSLFAMWREPQGPVDESSWVSTCGTTIFSLCRAAAVGTRPGAPRPRSERDLGVGPLGASGTR